MSDQNNNELSAEKVEQHDYFVFSRSENSQKDNLNSEMLYKLLLDVKDEELANIFVWRAGWAGWTLVSEAAEVSSILERSRKDRQRAAMPPPPPMAVMPPPLPPAIKVEEELHQEAKEIVAEEIIEQVQAIDNGEVIEGKSDDSVNITPVVAEDNRRQFTRYKLSFDVMIVCGREVFRSSSNDISLGGIQLSRPLPQQFHDKQCRVFISSECNGVHKQINFNIKLLGDSQNLCRIAFLEQDGKLISELESWIIKKSDLELAA